MKNYTFPRWTDLPEIDLYMDQVITYINEKLKDTYFYDEKFITKAMINNYVKTGIVHPPVKKHYTKSHLAYFLVLTILKRCYSMQQITSLLHIYTNMKDSTIEQAYDLFISRFEDSLNDVFKNNRNTIVFENANHEQELMDNVIQCIIYKMHTEYTLKKYEQELNLIKQEPIKNIENYKQESSKELELVKRQSSKEIELVKQQSSKDIELIKQQSNKNIEATNKVLTNLKIQIDKKMQQLQNQNIKLKETMQVNLVKMQEKSQKQEETIQELVLENRKLKEMLESMNSENQFTTAMLEAQMDKLLEKKLQTLKKVQQTNVVKPTKTKEIEVKPQHANAAANPNLIGEYSVWILSISSKRL